MKALITGGAGFIGSHLAERLLDSGHRVAIIDDLNDFYAPSMKIENLVSIGTHGAFSFHQADICDERTVLKIVGEERPEAIIHLAARAGIQPSLKQPLLYEQVNVRGTMILLEAARLAAVRKFVFASSSSIYGVANRIPFNEDDCLNLPISPYAATKIAGEKICYTYSHLYNLPVACLRFFTVYGPRQRPDLAIRKFTGMIESGVPIPVFGDGLASRDYTFIDDIVEGIRAALEFPCSYEILNLGNSHPVKLRVLIQSIEEALGKKAVIRRLPAQPGDVPITYADISKARRLLQYSPQTPLRQGLETFVRWFRAEGLRHGFVSC